MEPFKVYYSPGEYKGYMRIDQARRAFVNACLTGTLAVFVREDNMEFYDTTVNNPMGDQVTCKKLGSKSQFDKFLQEVF